MDKTQEKKQRPPKKRRTIKRGAKRALVVLLTLASLAAAGFLGYYLFQLTEVEVIGNDAYSDEQIVELADVQIGESIFSVDTGKIESNLSQFPYIKVVSVKRVYPSKLVIEMEERNMKLAVKYGDQYVLMDKNGTVIEMSAGIQNMIELRGVSVTGAAVGSKVQGLDDYGIFVIGEILTAFENSAIGKDICYIDITIPASITLGVRNGLKIRIGDIENLSEKRAWIDTLYPRLIEEGKRFGTLDASGKYGASYIPE